MSSPSSNSSAGGNIFGAFLFVFLVIVFVKWVVLEVTAGITWVCDGVSHAFDEAFEDEPEVPERPETKEDLLCSGGAENPGTFLAIADKKNVPIRPEYGAMLSSLARIESETVGNYEARGPIQPDGDRAYGRCQMMGKYIPGWSEEVLHVRLTPETFIANHKFQDIVCYSKVIDVWKQRNGNVLDVAATWQSGQTYAVAEAKGLSDGISPTTHYAKRVEGYFNQNLATCKQGGMGGMDWACPTDRTEIVSAMGQRTLRGKPDYHEGLDIDANDGNKNYAVADGIVIAAGPMGNCGNGVAIDHGGGIHTTTCHHKIILVNKGDHVTKGQVIGYSGTTGNSTGIHCHLSVSLNGASVDPQDYLPNRCKSGPLAKMSRTLVATN